MDSLNLIFLTYFLTSLTTFSSSQNFKLKYEYKYSFKGPYLSSRNGIPFWDHINDAFPSEDKVRLVPSLREKQGAVWSKYPFPYSNWEIKLIFRVTGKGHIGADGFVLWYVETPKQHGKVFGSMDQWKGLAVIFDSFDNDDKKDNPSVSLFVNNGTVSFNHASDGYEQVGTGCMADFRNRPYPSKIKLSYMNRQLQLFIDDGSNYEEEFTHCATMGDVELPSHYFFGLSAATGGLADDHDVLKFLTWSAEHITDAKESESEAPDSKEIADEYQKNVERFHAEQEVFKEKFPKKVKVDYGRPEDLFQGSSSEDLKKVFEVQNTIKRYINSMAYTVELVQSKQDTALRSLGGAESAHVEIAMSHHAQNAMKLQQLSYQLIQGLKHELDSVRANMLLLSTHVNKAGNEDAAASMNAGMMYESKQRMSNVMENLYLIEEELKELHDVQEKSSSRLCPKTPEISCAPTILFIGVAVAELFILLIYFKYKSPSVAVGKKYF